MRTRKIRHSALSHQDHSGRNLHLANLRLRPVGSVNLHRSVNLLPEASDSLRLEASDSLRLEASDSLRLELSDRSRLQGNSDSNRPIRLGCNHLPRCRKPLSPRLRSTNKKSVLAR